MRQRGPAADGPCAGPLSWSVSQETARCPHPPEGLATRFSKSADKQRLSDRVIRCMHTVILRLAEFSCRVDDECH